MSATMTDPYAVLGVSREATPDEVKKAYRKKARECHPDLNPDDPNAAERMNQVNEAYDRIMNPEKYAASDRRAASAAGGAGYGYAGGAGYGGGGYGAGGAGGSTSGGGYGYGTEGPYGWTGGFGFDFDDLFGFGNAAAAGGSIHPEVSARDSDVVRQAVAAINAGDCQRAVTLLASVAKGQRDARWYYLSALAHQGVGNTLKALDLILKAVQMEPQNQDYQRAQQQFQHAGVAYQQEGQARGFSVSFVDPGTICCGLCLAQMLCRAFLPYF